MLLAMTWLWLGNAMFYCGFASAEQDISSTPSPPNVILVVMDTLRADRLGCYGYSRNTSPRMDAFAERADVYTRCFAAAPATLSSHATLFTGLYPFQHGAHRDEKGNYVPLSSEHLTLAEVLRVEGYTTAAWSANTAFLIPHSGLNQGFEVYELEHLRADEQNQKVFEWLESGDRQPFFLFLNYMDTHRPYNCKHRPGFTGCRPEKENELLLDKLMEAVMADEPANEIPDDLVRKVVDQYDTAIANLDEAIGDLLDRLGELDLYDNSLIVLTSDHGEHFGEHSLVGHAKEVYQESLWVPLLIKRVAQQEGQVIETVVSLADVPALILSQLSDQNSGPPLDRFPARTGEPPIISESYPPNRRGLGYHIWGNRLNRSRRAIFDWPYKYIHSSDGKHELYDLEDDPREQLNLLEQSPEVTRRLRSQLLEFVEQEAALDDRTPISLLNEEQLEALRKLGYVADD